MFRGKKKRKIQPGFFEVILNGFGWLVLNFEWLAAPRMGQIQGVPAAIRAMHAASAMKNAHCNGFQLHRPMWFIETTTYHYTLHKRCHDDFLTLIK